MWDEKYSVEHFIYGTKPNTFLAEHANQISRGTVLSLAEGEGRNAVFLAELGYEVTAVDGSQVGIEKARQLAASRNVEIEFVHADLNDYHLGESAWDGIISIFCPVPRDVRKQLHTQIASALKPGGVFLLEAYTPAQLQHGTGGGDSAELMTTASELREDLHELQHLQVQELERAVVEGTHHTGLGAVVQVIAKR
ncbi:MAG: class I SAM-dependent methyltransferase [Phycisphaera sp.]|nr:MAG: class I SAM-dependent methyltransferase [Phycisphaera sp.]